MEICGKSGFENLKSTIHSLSGSSKPIEQGLVELARSRRVPNPMLQYADIQFLVSLVSYFGHGLSTMLHDQSLSSFCHELSDNVKVRFSDFKRHFSDNCFLILPL